MPDVVPGVVFGLVPDVLVVDTGAQKSKVAGASIRLNLMTHNAESTSCEAPWGLISRL